MLLSDSPGPRLARVLVESTTPALCYITLIFRNVEDKPSDPWLLSPLDDWLLGWSSFRCRGKKNYQKQEIKPWISFLTLTGGTGFESYKTLGGVCWMALGSEVNWKKSGKEKKNRRAVDPWALKRCFIVSLSRNSSRLLTGAVMYPVHY